MIRAMKFSWICGIIFGSAFLLAGTALGQGQISIEPPTPSGGGGSMPIAPPTATMPATAQPSSAPATAPAASIPSAESVLQQLLNNKAGATADHAEALSPIMPIGPVLGADGLLREGQQIEMRSGHLKKDESAEGTGAIIFVFDPKETPVYPPMGVIPSLRRAAMEDAAGFGEGRVGSDMTFRILAEVTEYRGKNYLYIRPSGIPVPAPAAQVAPAVKPLVNAAAPNVPAAQPLPERDAITNRIGRLVRDVKTGVELIAFDADGQRMADPPMGVIPCKYLAVIEDATDNGNKPLKFRVSGEVTSYRGKNYLYLKFVQQVRDLNGGIGAGTAVGG
jgi:hypothetical protein